ncbi:hypothetical protein LJR030_001463 [Rhizobium sp. LjRoot30]
MIMIARLSVSRPFVTEEPALQAFCGFRPALPRTLAGEPLMNAPFKPVSA